MKKFCESDEMCNFTQQNEIFCGNWKGQYSKFYQLVPKNTSTKLRCHHVLHFYNKYLKSLNDLCENNENISSIINEKDLDTIIQNKLKINFGIFDEENGNYALKRINGKFIKGIYSDNIIIFANTNNVTYPIHII